VDCGGQGGKVDENGETAGDRVMSTERYVRDRSGQAIHRDHREAAEAGLEIRDPRSCQVVVPEASSARRSTRRALMDETCARRSTNPISTLAIED